MNNKPVVGAEELAALVKLWRDEDAENERKDRAENKPFHVYTHKLECADQLEMLIAKQLIVHLNDRAAGWLNRLLSTKREEYTFFPVYIVVNEDGKPKAVFLDRKQAETFALTNRGFVQSWQVLDPETVPKPDVGLDAVERDFSPRPREGFQHPEWEYDSNGNWVPSKTLEAAKMVSSGKARTDHEKYTGAPGKPMKLNATNPAPKSERLREWLEEHKETAQRERAKYDINEGIYKYWDGQVDALIDTLRAVRGSLAPQGVPEHDQWLRAMLSERITRMKKYPDGSWDEGESTNEYQQCVGIKDVLEVIANYAPLREAAAPSTGEKS